MIETAMITVERFRDAKGQPTCAANFDEGRVCRFYTTQHFGCNEGCMAAGNWSALQRRDNGKGYLIPVEDCPVWPA
jgi:hypothetical protein